MLCALQRHQSRSWRLVVSDETAQQFLKRIEDNVVAIVFGSLYVERTFNETYVARYTRVPAQTAARCTHLQLTEQLINTIVLDSCYGGRQRHATIRYVGFIAASLVDKYCEDRQQPTRFCYQRLLLEHRETADITDRALSINATESINSMIKQ